MTIIFPSKYPLNSWRIKSEHSENIYDINLWGNGEITCDCPFSVFKKRVCKHKKEKLEYLVSVYGSILGAIEHYKEIKYKK